MSDVKYTWMVEFDAVMKFLRRLHLGLGQFSLADQLYGDLRAMVKLVLLKY